LLVELNPLFNYADPLKSTHAAGGAEAKEHYGIPYATGYDIAVCNAYGKASEEIIALVPALMALKPDSSCASAIRIADAQEGQVPHYVMRAWGSDYGGRHCLPEARGEKAITAGTGYCDCGAYWPGNRPECQQQH
jgi:hypothetical protein